MELYLAKLPTKLENGKAEYFLPSSEEDILSLNEFVGKTISLRHTGKVKCMDCQKIVKKLYAQGLCYVCTMSSPLNSDCIVRPELCEGHLGKGRDRDWEEKHHNQPHIVYLANSGGLKVGVTRVDQIPTRWIDQGADEAIILAKTPYRQLAGQLEVELKKVLSDKTNWRAMLKNLKDNLIQLLDEKRRGEIFLSQQNEAYEHYLCEDDTIYSIIYPAQTISGAINSVKLDKEPVLEGILTGIKGQYFILDNKIALNIRSHAGYEVDINFSE